GGLPFCTLVPYTTLFRSVGEAEVGDDRSDIADLTGESPSSQHREWVLNRLVQAVLTVIVLAGLAGAWGEGVSSEVEATGADGRLDRKSTRLNSSHVKTSY